LKMINRSVVISLSVLFMLFVTTAAFAHMDEDSGKTKDMTGSGMMKSGTKGSETSGRKGCSGMMGSGKTKGMMGSGMMKSGMMKGMMSSGMMKNMMNSGMMKKCRRMMAAGNIRNLINHEDELGLTDKQTAALKSLKSSLEKESIMKQAELRVAEIDLDDLLSRDKVNMSSVESKLKQIQALQTEIELSQIKAQLKARGLLSSEQRKAWKSLKRSK